MQDYSVTTEKLALAGVDVRQRVLSALVVIFTITTFVASGLLFFVQPMFAKLILPLLGGSPSVWNVCMLFFQTTLLLGYLYVHLSTRCLTLRRQIVVHLLLLVATLIVLPIDAANLQPPASANPVWWLLRTLTLTVGLPFFVVSTTAPLLQKWFAAVPVPSARDPYFLYSASNVGSMLALLGYPLVLEPLVGTRQLAWIWSGSYVVLAVLIGICSWCAGTFSSATTSDPTFATTSTAPRCTTRQRLRWIALAFVPSSLMLGVTTHISTDIAAVPLLWVAPLALYLATFALAFSNRRLLPYRLLIRVLPALVLACLVTILLNAKAAPLILLHVATFFVVAVVCHRELANSRPAPVHLTEFYLWLSFGGMIGGLFNSLLAPQVLSSILEYPLVLAAAALIRPSPGYRRSQVESWRQLVAVPACVVVFSVAMWALGALPPELSIGALLLTLATLLATAYVAANRTVAFGVMAMLFVFVIAFVRPASSGTVLLAARSFFGVHRVVDAADHSYHTLQHGSTTHGREQMSTADECRPTAYFHPSSPIGDLIAARRGHLREVAVVGLGTGALACYAEPGRSWTFYEIDPIVEHIAHNPRYFTYLQNSPGNVNVVLGDARISLQRPSVGRYDLIVLDAFSSDAIPMHLLTQEAIQLYFSRLRPDGIVAVHISNRYLKLEPILAAVAAHDGLHAITKVDDQITESEARVGKFASHWVVLASDRESLAGLANAPGWRAARSSGSQRVWTDDYSNIVQAIRN